MGTSPSAVVISPDGSLAYVTNGPDTVSVIDTKTYTVIRTVEIDTLGPETDGHVIALSPDGSPIYITDAYDRWVSLLAPASTAAPAAGTPDPTTAPVSGALNVKDPDGDALSDTITGPTTSGTVTVDPTGTYTPTQAARDQAAQTTGDDSTSFTVTASFTSVARLPTLW